MGVFRQTEHTQYRHINKKKYHQMHITLIPVNNEFLGYAKQIMSQISSDGFNITLDDSSATLEQKAQHGARVMLIVGALELEEGTVNVRTNENEVIGRMKVEDVLVYLHSLE
jgi:threonyl-tRNA synthetase